MQSTAARRGPERWILAGLAAGLLLGLLANHLTAGEPEARRRLDTVVREVIQPVGGIFLRLLFMTVIPLVFSCLALGVHQLGDLKELGRIGLKTLVLTLLLSAVSVGIGLLLVNTVEPGKRVDEEARKALFAGALRVEQPPQADRPLLERIIAALIPRNPVEAAARAFDGDMLAVLFFAFIFGVALRASGSARMAGLVSALEGLYDISFWLVGFALRLAPVGVAALVFSVSSRMGLPVLYALGGYVLAVVLGLLIQMLVVYPALLRFGCGVSPIEFLSRIRKVMVTAFSTSSSNATLPTTLQVSQTRLGIPPRIGNFVLTLGSTFNQNGTALFEGVTILFIAQFFGLSLSLEGQVMVIVLSILAGIGTAGVPGGSIPLLVPVLVVVGVPEPEARLGLGIILGVDRFLDMCRTVLNVTGDLVVATFIARSEKLGTDAIFPPQGGFVSEMNPNAEK